MDARTESGIAKAEPILPGAFHYTDESICDFIGASP